MINEYEAVLINSLPKEAKLLTLDEPNRHDAILLADLDGDQVDELIGAYEYQGENYLQVLKRSNNGWHSIGIIKGRGYALAELLAAPLTRAEENYLIVGWQVGGNWAELELYRWDGNFLFQVPIGSVPYSKIEVEDMPGKTSQDGIFEIALWRHDTGEAYKVDVYRLVGDQLERARDVYPHYFKKVAAFYKVLTEKDDYPFYWYYLSNAQKKSGDLEQAKVSIEKALAFDSSYPTREKLLRKRDRIIQRLQKRKQADPMIVASANGDVTGDGLQDTVFLTAEKSVDSPFYQQITLNVMDGKTHSIEKISLKENAGYQPAVFLGDLTGNGVDDVLISINSGGSGGMIYAYVYAFINGDWVNIFDSNVYYDQYKYGVSYLDGYKASVVAIKQEKKYILDLGYKGEIYLSEIYNSDGTLKEPITGWVNPLSGLYPVDYEWDGIYDLTAYQRIAGRYNADGLGYLINVLKWDGQQFVPYRQSVSVFGEEGRSN